MISSATLRSWGADVRSMWLRENFPTHENSDELSYKISINNKLNSLSDLNSRMKTMQKDVAELTSIVQQNKHAAEDLQSSSV